MALKLIKDVHMLITNQDGTPLLENNTLWVMDTRDNRVFPISNIPTVREFFNLNSENLFLDQCQQKDLTINVSENVTCDPLKSIENIENNCASGSNADNATIEYSATWEHSAIMLLFCLYKDHLTLFKNDKIRNDVVWRKIANGLKEKGYTYTVKQIENKWKNLRKNYIKIKDHNSKSGASFKKCKYYNQIEEIYGKSHSVQPVAIASNLSQNYLPLSTDKENKQSDEDNDVKRPLKKTKMEKQLQTLTKYMNKNEKEKERRHKERLEYQKEAVQTYKDFMEKLLEKL